MGFLVMTFPFGCLPQTQTGAVYKRQELEKDVTVVGVSSRLELWNTEKWEAEHSFDNFSPEELSEKMELLGL